MTVNALHEIAAATATKFGIPGIAIGVWADGQEHFGYHGVTSVENPLPVDANTLFQLGSVTKPLTATVIMRLVADGKIELDAPVRRYVPEFVLSDSDAAARITVAQLLNHTSGMDWSIINDTGEGDDALAKFVATLAELPMIGAPGDRASYSQAGFNVLGRVIEKVTGQTYEQAVASIILEPLGLTNTVFTEREAMTRRFAVGHDIGADGELSIARPWKPTRANNAGGGVASTVADQLRWARFHLGDGAPVLPEEVLHRMRQPTVELRGSSLGDAFGTCWFLREIDSVATIGHGGSSIGQFSELLIVPDRDFAIIVMANAGPDGIPANQAIVRWALEHYLGLLDRDPEPLPFDAGRAAEVAGHYESDAMTFDITTDGTSLTLEVLIKPEIRATSEELPADHAPFEFGLLPGDGDDYIITSGAFAGHRGFFSRDEQGAVVGVDLAGRLFHRVR
ncbi:serine hydrolase [Nocardia sp. XZ_19_385]|uniref:serine hydrolase domain-containing protein n=1 Tax=Nocardia sp. XZ_19_385 TaxID=2769488 RepID=UPI00188E060D|nr:serine hydrolase domain-containing protein [Nocardia sp. XZ_19_385]